MAASYIFLPLDDLYSVNTALCLASPWPNITFTHKNARERTIVEVQLGPLFAVVMGTFSVEGVLEVHRQCLRKLEPGTCHNLMINTMDHLSRHAFIRFTTAVDQHR